MWSILKPRPLGRASMRRVTLFVFAITMAFLTTLTVINGSSLAQEVPDNINVVGEATAQWSADNSGLTYTLGDITLTYVQAESGQNLPNLNDTCGSSRTNIYRTNTFPGSIFNEDDSSEYVSIICFATKDTSRAVDATQLYFRVGNDPQFTLTNSDPIKIVPYNEDGPVVRVTDGTATTGDEDSIGSTSRCDRNFTYGLGWIICPVTNWLAAGMDSLYDILENFLIVTPLSTDRDGFLYYIWGVVRNIANILFIVGFLIIIYSQITGAGISSYGIKKSLPRLLIAAILVNVSYWVSAIAVDLSNFLGASLHTLFTDVVKSVPESQKSDFNYSEVTFEAVAGVALSGGTAAAGVLGAAAGVLSTAGGSLWLLLVGLMGVLVSALVAILVMAARQALIIILIVLSPLAFVAYLLPSTEGYFNKWRGLFTTMLMVFPAFSVIFGGAQLAGLTIMYSADPTSGNYFNLIILGMIVQVMPVVITPLLIKLSGSLLGRVAGMVNDPNRGMIDRTRKFAEKRRDMTKNRQMYDFNKKTGRPRNNNPLAVAARWNALREIDSARKLKAWEATADALYVDDVRSHEVHAQSEISSMRKSIGDDSAKKSFAEDIASNSALRILDNSSRLLKEQAANAENKNKTLYEALQAKPGIASAAIRDIGGGSKEAEILEKIASSAQEISFDTKKEADRQGNIASEISDTYYSNMIKDKAWREYAGAADISDSGELRAKASAQSKAMSASNERVENYKKGFVYDKISKDAVLEKAIGKNIANQEEWEAAISFVADSKDTDNITKHFQQINLAEAPADIRQTFELAYKNSSSRPVFASAGKLGEIGQSAPPADISEAELMDRWRIDAAKSGKYGTAGLVQNASKEEIKLLTETLKKFKVDNNRVSGIEAHEHRALRKALEQAFQNRNYRTQMGDKEAYLRELGEEIFGIDKSKFDEWKDIP